MVNASEVLINVVMFMEPKALTGSFPKRDVATAIFLVFGDARTPTATGEQAQPNPIL
jgi:hypothetical protein